MHFKKENHDLYALRGATTCEQNSTESITSAVEELMEELIGRNKLNPDQIVSIIFSATPDLDACFPASIVSKKKGN